jgi:hypothetical protein
MDRVIMGRVRRTRTRSRTATRTGLVDSKREWAESDIEVSGQYQWGRGVSRDFSGLDATTSVS